MSYYPIFLDIKQKRCAVIGGGTVALRKIEMLLDHGALVDVISPETCAPIEEMAASGKIGIIRREYEPGDLRDAFVVIAATNDSQTNERIAAEAIDRGILINVVDVPKLSNFIVPSYLRRGDVTIAVSTNGKSPALARKIRSELEKAFGEEYALLASIISEIRTELKVQEATISGDQWHQALDMETLLELLRRGKQNEVKEALLTTLSESEGRL